VGLMSIPALVGNTLGTIVSSPFSDRLILWLARKNNGVYEPEMRLWLLLAFAPFFPAGMSDNLISCNISTDCLRNPNVRLRSWSGAFLAHRGCWDGHVLVRHAAHV
jgi:hypothetical protein